MAPVDLDQGPGKAGRGTAGRKRLSHALVARAMLEGPGSWAVTKASSLTVLGKVEGSS